MSTTLVTKENVTRKWYILDAAGQPMGKTAAMAAENVSGQSSGLAHGLASCVKDVPLAGNGFLGYQGSRH